MKAIVGAAACLRASFDRSWHWRNFALGLYGVVTKAQVDEVISRYEIDSSL
jgi:hypothetical protein